MEITTWFVISPWGKEPWPIGLTAAATRRGAMEHLARTDYWNGISSENKERRNLIWKKLYRQGYRLAKLTTRWDWGLPRGMTCPRRKP